MSPELARPGLEGVVAGKTQISCVDQGKLLYRGYPIEDLAGRVSFEDVAHLLIYGELPSEAQVASLREKLKQHYTLRSEIVAAIRSIPHHVPMMDVLRSSISLASHFCSGEEEDSEDRRERAVWLMAVTAAIVGARFRLRAGQEPVDPQPGLSHAAQILHLCHGVAPDDRTACLLDLTLVLYAEHEFNASTFTARVIGSTLSDMVSAVVGAVGALKGSLHGGANERALELLRGFKSKDEAVRWLREALKRKVRVTGFGHRVYKNGDHRTDILERQMRPLAEEKEPSLLEIYDAIKDIMVTKEKPIFPNVDYPCGLTYHVLDLPPDLYTPLFVCSRVTGWCAHFIEQLEDNKLYRPLSAYVGHAQRNLPDGR